MPVGDDFVGCFVAPDGEQLRQRNRHVPTLPADQQRCFCKREMSPFLTVVLERSQSRHEETRIPVRLVILVPKVRQHSHRCALRSWYNR